MSNAIQPDAGPDSPVLDRLPPRGSPDPATLAASDPGLRPEPEPLKPDIPDHELLSCIGRGSYGEVWLARNVMGTWRAVKVVYRSTFENHRPFEREFQGIQRFEPISRSHPSQVGILHIGRNDDAGYFYYVMDLADDDSEVLVQPETARKPVRDSGDGEPDGEAGTATSTDSTWKPKNIDPAKYQPRTLRSELKKKGQLSFDRSLRISMALATALHHLHRHRLVHRDIKPANIIFINGLPKMADIGLVTGAGESRTIVGTEGYLAPEGSGTVQADIYSLGKVMYDMVFGRKGQDFPGLPPDWIELDQQAERIELNEVILRACETEPVSRYSSARELLRDLELIQSGRSVKHLRWLERQQKTFIRASVIGSLVTLVALAGWWWQKKQADVQKELTGTIQAQANDLQTRKEELRRSLYAADMLTLQVVTENWFGRGEDHQEVFKPLFYHVPNEDESDLRGFEWRYLWGQIQDDPNRALPIGGDYFALSPDGSTIYSGYNQVNILDRASDRITGGLRIRSEQICSMSLSRDGRFLAVGSDRNPQLHPEGTDEGHVEVWDMEAPGKPIAALQGRMPRIEFSPVNHRVLAVGVEASYLGGSGGHALLWTLDGPGGSTVMLPDRGGRVAFSSDGLLLATGPFDSQIQIWDAVLARRVRVLAVHDRRMESLKFSPDGRWLAVGLYNGDVCVWDIAKDWAGPRVLNNHPIRILDIDFTRDGRRMVTLGSSGVIAVTVWDTSEFAVSDVLRANGASEDLEICQSNRTVIAGGLRRGLREWDLDSSTKPHQIASVRQGPFFSADSRYFATVREGIPGAIEIRDCKSMALICVYAGSAPILGFVPEEPELVSLGRDTEHSDWCVLRWNYLQDRQAARVILRGSSEHWGPCSVSPDWRLVAVGDTSGSVHFFDMSTGEKIRGLEAHDDAVRHLAWSTDGRLLATADSSGDVSTWKCQDWTRQATSPHFEGVVSGMEFSPDSRQLLLTKWAGAEAWDPNTFKALRKPGRGGDRVCTISPDSKTVCLDVANGIILAAMDTGRDALIFHEESNCQAAKFSPNGEFLGTRDRTGLVRIRRAPTLEEIDSRSRRRGLEAYYAPMLAYDAPDLEVPGIITAWQVSGAYQTNDFRQFDLFDVAFEPETSPHTAKWSTLESEVPIINLAEFWHGNQRVAYLSTSIQAPAPADARLELGSDDGIKVWLNDELIHANNVGRGHRFAEDVVEVRLKKGRNILMLKVTQGTGRWVTSARLIGRDGEPLEGVTFSNAF